MDCDRQFIAIIVVMLINNVIIAVMLIKDEPVL